MTKLPSKSTRARDPTSSGRDRTLVSPAGISNRRLYEARAFNGYGAGPAFLVEMKSKPTKSELKRPVFFTLTATVAKVAVSINPNSSTPPQSDRIWSMRYRSFALNFQLTLKLV